MEMVILSSIILSYFIYKCHKINLNRGHKQIDSPDWIKNKIATKNRINKINKCFQYAITVGLNYEEIGKIITKNKYNWESINEPPEK